MPHREDAIRVLAHGAMERGRLPECVPERALRLALELDEDRAHLQADAARLEQRQPRPPEDVLLAEPVLAVRKLQEQIVVGVGDHRLTILSAMTAVAPTDTFAVTNPATGEVLAAVPRHGVEETRLAIAAAERAYPAWRARPAKERARILRRLADLMLERQEELARLLTSEQGKPLAEARAEVAYAASFFEWFGEEAKRVYGDTIPAQRAATAGSWCSRSRSASPRGSRPGTSPPR